MDFGRPLEKKKDLVSRSNIRVLPSSRSQDETDTDPPIPSSLDDRLLRAANQAAIDLFGSPSYDCTSFFEYSLPQSPTIQPNDLVVVFESFDNLSFVYAQPGRTFSNRNGDFEHSSFIGSSWGSKIRSTSHKGYGFVHLLKPTPELWARSLTHRTQIVHELDASMILHQLWLKPNMILLESGTGSGALSHAALRTLAPHGQLHTYDFHEARYQRAKSEFQQHSLGHLVTCHLRDVTKSGFVNVVQQDDSDDDNVTTATASLLRQHSVDAVVLDLPEPWLVVQHAQAVLKAGGRIASYSPCFEQCLKTCQALQQCGFHSIKTMEYRLREYHVDSNVELPMPPSELRAGRRAQARQGVAAQQDEEAGGNEQVTVSDSNGRVNQDDNDDDKKNALSTTEEDDEPHLSSSKRKRSTSDVKDDEIAHHMTENGGDAQSQSTRTTGNNKRMVCARPFATMRGHSAFLTFATAGNSSIAIAATARNHDSSSPPSS